MDAEHIRTTCLYKFEDLIVGEGTVIVGADAIISFMGDKGRSGFLN